MTIIEFFDKSDDLFYNNFHYFFEKNIANLKTIEVNFIIHLFIVNNTKLFF